MECSKKSKKNINAIIWGVVMIISAVILSDSNSDNNASFLMLLILAWFMTDSVNNGKKLSAKEEIACVRNFFTGKTNSEKEDKNNKD